MADKGALEKYSADELRWMLMEKRRSARRDRLERFRRNGRVVLLSPEAEGSLSDLRTGEISAGAEYTESREYRPPLRRRILDGLLLLVEIGAVLGLVLILLSGMKMLQELNREAGAVMLQPTLTPTPLIVAIVLPSGHTPPTGEGGTRPNEAEIPEHLRPLVQSLSSIPVPTPGPEQAVRIQIPAINVDAPIVQGDGWEQLKKGVGQYAASVDPGKNGNLVLSAHNDIFGEIFRYLDQLENGDEVVVYTSQRAYTYVVTKSQIVEPTAVDVMAPTKNPTVTLISCWPYLVDDQRIIVQGRLKGS